MSNPIRRLYQSFFVIGDPSGTTSGAIYGKGIVLPNGRLGEPNSFSHEMYGDVLSIGGFSTFSAGDTVTSEISITWSGSNVFDPSAVSSLLLTWGTMALLKTILLAMLRVRPRHQRSPTQVPHRLFLELV